ncbi:NAD(P)/FAD-dependent oxidoreductase [Frigidibacter sp. RF13]|uniref:flavin monoamine oxidase family protein n=1 Tax=Frigidibacter sp. RF13 TaxID=2997340 RepID=UPI00226DA49B|nr:NAD(P)/FAD-dependent oxidoreductase [Frigidibacter sp. RF13]MCY1127316.1 NAD(P)/FAD-dependent oxidoreductase [Frigidibacter sp. RF13]
MDTDVVVVGAGAAGIGAGLELQSRGRSFVILEAADRIGGRAFTDAQSLPGAWDHGCHWLHSADINPLVPWADRFGADVGREQVAFSTAQWRGGRWLDAAEEAAADLQLEEGFAAVYAAGTESPDRSLGEALAARGMEDPFLRSVMTYMACDDPEQVSAQGYAAYEDTGVNWPVRSGLGALIARMAEGLPVRLNAPVTAIAERPGGVRVEGPGGAIDARAAIVTVSTNVLLSGAISLPKGPARDLLDEMAHVPCGSYEKVALALDRLPEELIGRTGLAVDMGADRFLPWVQVVEGAAPMLILHLAGSHVRDLVAAGEAAMKDEARSALERAFGSTIRERITGAAVTGWQSNPLTRGAYSYAVSGKASSRARMIAADTGRIAFAGEAFSPRAQATAHGAYQSGRDVAARLLAMLG